MSYLEEDTIVEDAYRPPRHHRHELKEKVIVEEKYSSSQVWLWGFCCVIVIFFVVLFIVSIFYWGRVDNFRNHMNQFVSEVTEQNSIQSDTKNMISFSALAATALTQSQHIIKTNKLGLCYTDILKSDTDDPKSSTSLSTVSVNEEISYDKSAYYFALDFKMSLEFDVDVSSYVLKSKTLDRTQRYMTLSYLITSSYTRFSTIKLIETGLDIKTKTLMRTKEVILCSNNPSFESIPCSSFDDSNTNNIAPNRNSIFIKNTKLIVMSKLVPWLGGEYDENNNNNTNNNYNKNNDFHFK